MNELQLTNALGTIGASLILAVVLFWLFPMYRVDVFRQKMYALRDEFFDYALAGNISFNDPAYVLLRRLMNGLIRYGHKLTVYRLFMSFLFLKVEGRPRQFHWNAEWESALPAIQDPAVRERVRNFHSKTMLLMSQHLIFGSPLLMIVLLCGMLGLFLKQGYIGFRSLCRSARDTMMSGVVINQHFIEEQAVSTQTFHRSLFGMRPFHHNFR